MSFSSLFDFHGVKFFSGSLDDLMIYFQFRLSSIDDLPTTFIATPNPEFYIESIKDRDFFLLLKNTSFNITDGIGLHFLLRLFGYPSSRITGSGLVAELFSHDICSIYLLGGMRGSYKKIKERYPKINFVGGYDGIVNSSNSYDLCNEINKLEPDFLLVGLGAPKQEKWIRDNLKKIPSVKIAIGVGGSLDFSSLQVRRAPKIFQVFGFEWLFRLCLQPSRYMRILKAVLMFPICFIFLEILFCFRKIIKSVVYSLIVSHLLLSLYDVNLS